MAYQDSKQKTLAAKNYSCVLVSLRDEDLPIKMTVLSGLKLMDYLTSGKAASHVQITSDGEVMVVKITDIRRVEPVQKLADVSEYV